MQKFFSTKEGVFIAPSIFMGLGNLDDWIDFLYGKTEYSVAGPIIGLSVITLIILVISNSIGRKKYQKKLHEGKRYIPKTLPGDNAPGKKSDSN